MSSVHIAIFKWKEGTEEAKIDKALDVVRDLRLKVSGIKDIMCGRNYHPASKGFTHGVVVIADSREALEAYRHHPDHMVVAPLIEAIEQDGIGFDFDDLD